MHTTAEQATALVTRIIRGAGATEAIAASVARVLVDSEAAGVRTHGLARVPEYVDQLRGGFMNPTPRMSFEGGDSSIVHVDGDNGPGAAVAEALLERSIAAAERTGVAIGTARRGNHLGALGYYVRRAADRGMLGFITQSTFATMAPWGGAEPTLGNNPFAIALPRGGRNGLLLDMACSVAARGHVSQAQRRGEQIPFGWALDRDGRPTTDPAAALEGVLLPFGEHKGSGIAMLLGALSGVLSRGAYGTEIEAPGQSNRPRDVGIFLMLVDVSRLLPRDEYNERIDAYVDQLLATRPVAEGSAVRVPGARQEAQRRASEQAGLDIDQALWTRLLNLNEEMGTASNVQ